MAPVTVGLAVLLIALGVGSWLATGSEHPTALIPTWFGIVFLLLGLVAFKDNLRKHAMHAAAALGLFGFLATAVLVVRSLANVASGQALQRPGAFASQAIMALLCAVFVGLCVRSFIMARRSRARRQEAVQP